MTSLTWSPSDVASGGGLHAKSGKDYLFDVKVMGRLLRGKMLDALRKSTGSGAYPELSDAPLSQLIASLTARKC